MRRKITQRTNTRRDVRERSVDFETHTSLATEAQERHQRETGGEGQGVAPTRVDSNEQVLLPPASVTRMRLQRD